MKKRFVFASTLLLVINTSFGHPNHDSPSGAKGPKDASAQQAGRARTVQIEMRDAGCSPREIKAARGESLKLVATNKTSRPQDLAVGTASDLKGQAEMIRKFPQMQAPQSSRVSVKPGESGELAWNAAGDAVVACGAPGEFDASRATKVTLTAK